MWNEKDKAMLFICLASLSIEGCIACFYLDRIWDALI